MATKNTSRKPPNTKHEPPQHIAIIMDGNRRWARKNKLKAIAGHKHAALKVIEPLVDQCIEEGVKFLTLWAFSTENWKRSQEEVSGLMNLFREGFKLHAQKIDAKKGRISTIGDLSRFPSDLQQSIHRWIEKTKNNQGITVTFALNYGGRDELLRATRKIAQAVKNGKISLSQINEQLFTTNLDTAGLPDPELIIRTGGEMRTSGFLPWQGVYSELIFTETLFPNFTPKLLHQAILEFSNRHRRFGK